MDWELHNKERDFARKIIELEIKNFNKRIKRQESDLRDGIIVKEWILNEFILCTEDIERILGQILSLKLTKKITENELCETSGYGVIKERKIIECIFYLGGELLTNYGIKL